MKKIILGTVLACLASGSVMADDNSLFNKHCRFDRVVDGVRVQLDLAVKGDDTFAKARQTSPGHPMGQKLSLSQIMEIIYSVKVGTTRIMTLPTR